MRESGHRAIVVALLLLAPGCNNSRTDNESRASDKPRGVPSHEITTKSGVPMLLVPGGEFLMGDDRGDPDETPAHRVRVSAFFMDKHEVTHEQFSQVQLPNPSHWQSNPRNPVERVRWRDAKRYCNERSLMEGRKPCYAENTADWDCDYAADGYRLPTEAEWEYACRAGNEFDSSRLRHRAWTAENSDQKTHPVGQKKPNALGICDLLGNVSEWCEDVYSPTYYRESPSEDPHGPTSPGKDARRVIRGGSWKSNPEGCRPTARQGERTGNTDACFSTDYCGFRCVRRATPEELQQMESGK